MRRGSRRSLSGLLITVALHAVIFWAVKEAHSHPQEALIVQRDFVRAEMVKLGKPRDKFWLPKPYVPPPPPPPDAIKLSNNPDAGAAHVEAPKLTDPKTSKAVKSALARADKLSALIPEEDKEGLQTGSKVGTANEAKGDPYDALVIDTVKQNYTMPAGLTPDQIPELPEIQFKVGPDGRISNVKLTKSSGNPLVNDACVSAAQQAQRVEQPPPGGKAKIYAVACRK
jgi:periplasmic protein TonB